MFESVLADVLTRVLGQYVTGIDRDSVSLGVWKGALELKDLTLRADALAVLFETLGVDLPVTVTAGSIGLLRVVVPWKTQSSVEVHAEHVTIVARPVGGRAAADDLRAREARLARARLDTDDAVRDAAWAVRAEQAAPAGWMARTVARVVENIALSISDVVIRFEDAESDARKPYAVAVACDRVHAATADARWVCAYVQELDAAVSRKVITLEGFRVAWESIGAGVEGRAPNESHSVLREAVDGAVGDAREIVAPFGGVLRASIARDAAARAAVRGAAVELDVDFPDVVVAVDEVQYASLLQTSVYFAKLASRGFRPRTAAERWTWGVEQILPGFRERARRFKCLSVRGMRRRAEERQLYVAARCGLIKARRSGVPEPPQLAEELEKMEGELRYDDVLLYRDLADERVAEEVGIVEPPSGAGEIRPPGVDAPSPEEAAAGGGYGSTFWRVLGYSTEKENDGGDAPSAAADERDEGVRVEEGTDVASKQAITTTAPSTAGGASMASSPSASSSHAISLRAEQPALRAGFLLRKGTVRMLKGGAPSEPTPMLEIVLQDLRVGVTTSNSGGLVMVAVLGTLEAWDLQTKTAIVYPRVPWDAEKHSLDIGAFTAAMAGVRAVDDTAYNSDEEPAPSGSAVGLETANDGAGYSAVVGGIDEADHSGGGSSVRIPHACYPIDVEEAIGAIRSSVVRKQTGDGVGDVLSDEAPSVAQETGLSVSPAGPSASVSGVDNEEECGLADSLSSPVARTAVLDETGTGFANWRAPPFSLSTTADDDFFDESRDDLSSRLYPPGSHSGGGEGSGTDTELESLKYLVALRVSTVAQSEDGSTSAIEMPCTVADVAVGRLEAVVDGPKSSFLWGLRFWQPKVASEDPIVSFLGAAAGARVAELRMELKNALLSQKDPMRVNAVICAPRFIFPGPLPTSASVVVNMGTFGFRSPVSDSSAVRQGSAGERYSTYEVSLDNLSVYLSPRVPVTTSRDLSSMNKADEHGFSGISSRSHNNIERLIRPFSVRLVLSLLQDVKVVQAARHGREEDRSFASLAKVRLRGQIPGIRLVLSERTWHDVVAVGKLWTARAPSPNSAFTSVSPVISSPSSNVSDQESSGDAGDVYDVLPSTDSAVRIDTVSLELRDRAGSRIITFLASGTRAKLVKTGREEILVDFRLESWTVTDGTRGTTAAFRRLAYAGLASEDRGASPPHSLSSPSSYRSGSLDEQCFVHVQYRRKASSQVRTMSIRFLSLHMICVRETYTKLASFFGCLSRELKASRPVRSAVHSTDSISVPQQSGCGPQAISSQASPTAPGVGDSGPKPSTSLNVRAMFDGFSLQLVSAEGALADLEMRDCAIAVDKREDGVLLARGDVGHVRVQDLTSPVQEHVDAIVYDRIPALVDRMDLGSPEDGESCPDSWSIEVGQEESKHVVRFNARCRGLRVTFLNRFLAILSRYVTLLRRAIEPAFHEVREAVDIASSAFVEPESDPGVHQETSKSAPEVQFSFDVVAEDLQLRLPRHSNCPFEAVVLNVRKIHLVNLEQAFDAYSASVRVLCADTIGRVEYKTPDESLAKPSSSKAPFLRSTACNFRFDVLPVSTPLSEDDGDNSGRYEPPGMRCQLLVDDGVSLELCEAQYTVLYFVLTENFTEIVDASGTDFGEDYALNPVAGSSSGCREVEAAGDSTGEVCFPQKEAKAELVRFAFHIPSVSVVLARGWDISARCCHLLRVVMSTIKGTMVSSSSGLMFDLAGSFVDVLDLRPEAGSDSAPFVLPLERSLVSSGDGATVDGGVVEESLSIVYEKPKGRKANIAVVLNNVQLRVIPDLFRDLSCVAVPGWPFLPSSEMAPPFAYLGRELSLTFSKSQVWLGAEVRPGDPRALILCGELVARISWMKETGAKRMLLNTKGLSIVLTYDRKQMIVEDAATAVARRVALPVSPQDNHVLYPGDGSMEYVGPNVDESGRRVEVLAEFVLCRLNVKELPLIAAVLKRLGRVPESYLSRRAWTQANPLEAANLRAVGGGRSTLASSQAVATRKTLTILMSSPAARVLFTDESRGKFVPILEWTFRNMMVQANMPRVVQFASEISVNLFNEVRGWWEPGLELWPVEVSMSEGESGSRAFSITSHAIMSFNVSPSIVHGAMRVGSSLRSIGDVVTDDYAARELSEHRGSGQRPSVAAFHIRNKLGLPFSIWLPHDSVRRNVKDGDEVAVDLPRDSLVPGVDDQLSRDDNSSREQALRCFVDLPGYEALELSAVNVGKIAVSLLQHDFANPVSSLALSDSQHDIQAPLCQLQVTWEVVMEGGVPVGTLRSPIRILNETSSPIEVMMDTSGEDLYLVSDTETWENSNVIVPSGAFCIPLFATASQFRVRPVTFNPPDRAAAFNDDAEALGSQAAESNDGMGGSLLDDLLSDAGNQDQYPDGSTRRSSLGMETSNRSRGHAFNWSEPLPDMSWMCATASEANRGAVQSRKRGAPAFLRALNPGSSTVRSQTTVATESVCCLSTAAQSPDFCLTVSPRCSAEFGLSPVSDGGSPPWLDIALEPPLVLTNMLPGLLSYRVLSISPGRSNRSHGEFVSPVLASGVLQPYGDIQLHTADIASKSVAISLAYENSARRLAGPNVAGAAVESHAEELSPMGFGPVVCLADLDGDKRGLCVEQSSSASSSGVQSKRDMKELHVQLSSSSARCLTIWSQFWVRNRSDTALEFCGRPSFYGSSTAVRPLRARPPGTSADKFVCFEGPYISLRRVSLSGDEMSTNDLSDWWTHQADLRDTEKPVAVGLVGASLILEVRAAAGCMSTMIVTVRNASWVVNRTPSALQWCQSSALDSHGNVRMRDVNTLPPGASHPVHWHEKAEIRAVNLRLAEEDVDGFSGWFWSPAVPMDIGNKGEFPAKMYRPKSQEQYIARVVSLKLHGGSTSVFVYPEDRTNPPYRLVNLCQRRAVAFHQVGSESRPWLVRPGRSTRYSWDDPLASTKRRELRVEVIESMAPPRDTQRSPSAAGSSSVPVVSGTPAPSTQNSAASKQKEFHHPAFNLNIDMVNEKPDVRKGSFNPPLYVSISVDGATKVVTFLDSPEEDPKRSSATRGPPDTRATSFSDDVPTVLWDEFGHDSADGEPVVVPDPDLVYRDEEDRLTKAGETFSDYPVTCEESAASNSSRQSSRDVDVNVYLSCVGLSLIDASPVELAYLRAGGVFLKIEEYEMSSHISFDVTELQVDNQLLNAAFPVLAWAPPLAGPTEASRDTKFLAVEGRRTRGDLGIAMWKHIHAAVRPLDVAIDEELILRAIKFSEDVSKGSDSSPSESLAGTDGEHISIGDLYDPDAGAVLDGSPSRYRRAGHVGRTGLDRIYVEDLKFYPVKIFLSSTASRSSMRSAGYKYSSVRTLVAILLNVEDCEFDFAALELRHVFDSSQHFALRVKEYYLAQLSNQRMKLLASNSLVGNPAALFDSVSIGARDLFVEPGRAKDSAEFLASVGRGSKSLITHTVGGLVGSIGGIPKALAAGMETAVGDRQYLAERERIRSHQLSGGLRPLATTPAQGVVTGAMSFAHGITSGVTGIFREPVVGAKRGGTSGFLRGMGRGLVGGVVKPVTGVMDLIAEPAVGLSKSVTAQSASHRRRGGVAGVSPVRPPRPFGGSGMRLIPFDMRAAIGAAFLQSVQSSVSPRISGEVLEWVELSDRPGRGDNESVDFIWGVLRTFSRTVRGARRSGGHGRAQSSESASGSSRGGRVEKTQVALVLEGRLLIVTFDCSLISDFSLDKGTNFEAVVGESDTCLVLQSARRGSSSAQEDSLDSPSNVVHEWGRIECESVESCRALREAVSRALASLRQRHVQRYGKMATRQKRSSSGAVELQNFAPIDSRDRTDVAELPGSSSMPGRSAEDNDTVLSAKYPKGLHEHSSTRSLGTERALDIPDVTSVVRRLKMGGTSRAIDSKRSIRVIIACSLPKNWSLRLIRSSLDDGIWRVEPPASVESGDARLCEADCGSRSDSKQKWQMERDIRGTLLYGVTISGIDDVGSSASSAVPQISLNFANPVLSSTWCSTKYPDGFIVSSERGSGAHAAVTFVVRLGDKDTDATKARDESRVHELEARARNPLRLPLPRESRSTPNVSGSLSSMGSVGAASAGRLFQAGSRRFLDAATSFGTGRNEGQLQGSRSAASAAGRSSSNSRGRRDGRDGRHRSRVDAATAHSLSQLVELGFDEEAALSALTQANGDLVGAVDILTR